jgi:hypothetical protein
MYCGSSARRNNDISPKQMRMTFAVFPLMGFFQQGPGLHLDQLI